MAGRDIFLKAVEKVLELEGGYVDDPVDPGGETKYGISKRAYPELDIKNLTKADAIAIYESDYWEKAGCDRAPREFALALFDAAVNHGVRQAVRLFQRTLDVAVDGIYGTGTQAAAMRAAVMWEDTLIDFLSRRAVFYAELDTFYRFGRGWMRRLFEVHRETIFLINGPVRVSLKEESDV